MSALFGKIANSLVECQVKKVKELVQQAVDDGCSAKQILNEGLLAGMNEVGVLFKAGEMFVPEVLMSAKAMQAGMEIIAPLLNEGDMAKKGKVVLATVQGDLHDIGTKLVSMMMSGAGYEMINLGIDVAPETIVEAVNEHKPAIVGMAAMLTTTMVAMKDTIEALKDAGLYDKVHVMIGGAPVTDRYAKEVGAHYASDATSAVEIAAQLLVS